MKFTTIHLLFVLIAFLSFLLGRVYGRTSSFEDIMAMAQRLKDIASYRFVIDYERINRTFHWGTDTGMGLKFYGVYLSGFQVGYTRKMPLDLA